MMILHTAANNGNAALSSTGMRIDPSLRCASYARFSSDLQNEESNFDQQRKCREKAAANGHVIAPELEFADEAISGTKRHRPGLDRMLAAAEDGQFQVLYLPSLSRLARETVITLPLLKRLVCVRGIRVVCVAEGIDSTQATWDLLAGIMALVSEQYVDALSAHVFQGG